MKIGIVILLTVFIQNIFAQDTIDIVSLSSEQYKAWKPIEDNFLKEQFYPFLIKEKIKLNCSGCESATIGIYLKNSTLKTEYKIESAIKCDKPFSKQQLKQIEQMLLTIKLPRQFNSKVFFVKLGSRLKC
jgi:hypothetical protein